MLSNAKVNVSYKMDYFPLRIEDDRARSHHDEESDESPTLIDPCSEDPRDHIRFHLDEPKSISERGKISIIVFGLRDPRLQDDRMRHLGYLGVFKDIIAAYEESADDRKTSALTESIERAKQILIEAVTPSAPFSSMAIDFLDR